MKMKFLAILSILMMTALTACTVSAETISSSSNSSTESSISSEESKQSEEEDPVSNEPLYVADAARFLGTVEEFAVDNEGRTVLQMRRAVGSGYVKTLNVTLTENTKFDSEKDIANGTFLEIFYGSAEDTAKGVEAIAVNNRIAEDLTIYNGTLVSVTPDAEKEGTGSLLLDPLTPGGMQFVFHYDPSTQFYLDFSALKPGDQLHVYHSPAATFSIPPQSAAYEISPYQAPEEGELPQPVAE